jgi:hypothetical protein
MPEREGERPGLNGDAQNSDAPAEPHSDSPSAGELTAQAAENQELRAEVERLRAERDRWLETQRRVMELLGTKSSQHIVHDLRNVLNERNLYKSLADLQDD